MNRRIRTLSSQAAISTVASSTNRATPNSTTRRETLPVRRGSAIGIPVWYGSKTTEPQPLVLRMGRMADTLDSVSPNRAEPVQCCGHSLLEPDRFHLGKQFVESARVGLGVGHVAGPRIGVFPFQFATQEVFDHRDESEQVGT